MGAERRSTGGQLKRHMGSYDLSPNWAKVKEAQQDMKKVSCPECGRERLIPKHKDEDEHKCGYCRGK